MHCEPEDKEVRLHRPIPDQLFVDLPYPYSVRLDNLKHVLCGGGAHRLLRSGLSLTFDRLYTSNKGYGHPAGALLRAVLVALTLVPIPVIATAVSRGGTAAAYDDGADLSVTYVLLCCTAGLDVASALSMACLRRMRRPPWPDQVAQCNLVAYLVHSEQRGWLCRIACLLLGCRGYLDWLWCTAPSRSAPSPSGITELVHSHICTQWMEHVKGDADAYRAFSDSRGHWTLDKEWPLGGEKRSFDNVASSSLRRRPFDESVVVWHLATDFCFYSRVDDGSTANRRCREISNYMVYLLLVNPAMLMPGARRRIVTAAYAQIREMLVREEDPQVVEDEDELAKKKVPRGDKEEIVRMIIQKLSVVKEKTSSTTTTSRWRLVEDAWALATELLDLKEEEEMWKVLRGVWVEMLCFSASRCRGYLHAKSLATGGEYLSYVWLLQAYMGMETLPHRMQETEQGDLGASFT